MANKKISSGLKLGLVLVGAMLLAGCLPPGPKALVDGQRRLEQGDLPRAIERLETATQLMNTNAHAWNYLGIAYHQAGQLTNAARAYQRSLQADRNLLEVRLNYGSLLLDMGRAAEAKLEFTAYTLRRPSGAEGFERLATAELQTRELPAAEAHARKAIQLDEANADAWNALGMILAQRNRPTEAGACFAKAVELRPGYAAALLNQAVVLHRQLNDRPGALKLYRQYLGLNPKPADAAAVEALANQLERELTVPMRGAAPAVVPPVTAAVRPTVTNVASVEPVSKPAVVVPSARPPTAVAPVSSPAPVVTKPTKPAPSVTQQVRVDPVEVVKLPPEPVVRPAAAEPSGATSVKPVTRADAETAASNPAPSSISSPQKESRSTLEKLNPLNLFRREPKPAPTVTPLPPKESSAPADVVLVEEPKSTSAPTSAPSSIAKPASAFARYTYRERIAVTTGDRSAAEIHLSQGNVAMNGRNYGEATKAYEAATQADPSWQQAYFNLAAAALESGRTSEALTAGETAVALKPDSADARYNFALALRRGNYVPDAAAQLEKLLASDPEDVRAHLTLGNIYAQDLRMEDKARVHYRRVLELAPRHAQAQSIRYWLKSHPPR